MLELVLTEACLETTAKKAYRRRLNAALSGDLSAADEAALELLATFLAKTDFRRVRAEDPALAGGSGQRVRLRRGEDGAVVFVKLPAR